MFLVMSVGLVGSARAGHATDLRDNFFLALAIIAWALFAATVNDFGDRNTDRANLGHTTGRPIADGDLNHLAVSAVVVVSATVSVASAALLSPRTVIAVLCGIALAVAYSLPPFRLSSRGALTSALLPLIYVVVPYTAGRWAAGPGFDHTDMLLIVGLYVSFTGRLMLKDFRDQHGDALYGKRTFLVRYGRKRTCTTSAFLWVVGAATLLIAQRSLRLTLMWLPLAALAVFYIVRIARDQWGGNDVYHIAIVAIAGRATLTMLLTDLGIRQIATGAWLWWPVQATLMATSIADLSPFARAALTHPTNDRPLPAVPPVLA
jgi:4-hydroxybenzoate polyprenyltransferase